MKKTQYLALLRGINVGGNNIIKKDKLKKAFEDLGLENVATYIQSGNVLFSAPTISKAALMEKIEKGLSKEFNYQAQAVVLTLRELSKIVIGAPRGFGKDLTKYRCDVIFLKPPLTAAVAMKSISTKEGVDAVHSKPGVLYFSRLTVRATQSHLFKIVLQPMYKSVTIRNWNTTSKLLNLMEESNKKL